MREVEERIVEATRSWTDDLAEALVEQLGEERGTELFAEYRDAFPAAYREDFTPAAAVLDIQRMERLDPEGDLEMTLYRPARGRRRLLRPQAPALGPADPALGRTPAPRGPGREGVRRAAVRDRPRRAVDAWIYDFGLTSEEGPIDLDEVGEAFKDAFAQAWRGEIEVDGFNRLVLRAGLNWREVAMLRALAKYLRQAGQHLQPGVHGADARRPPGDRPQARPALPRSGSTRTGDRATTPTDAESLAALIEQEIDDVPSLDEDRILRSYLRLVQATLQDELLPARRRGEAQALPLLQARPCARARPAPAAPAVRDLGLLTAHRGRAPPRRQGGARRHPLVGPPRGLPHRGARADEGADGEERRHRPRRRQGRLRGQAAAGRPRRAQGGGRRVLPDADPRPPRPHRQPRRRRGGPAARRRPLRRRRPVPRGRRGQGHGLVLRRRQRHRRRVRLLARRRVRLGRLRRLRPQGHGRSPPAAPGSRSSATSASWASTSSPPTSPSSASATWPATSSATACSSRGT